MHSEEEISSNLIHQFLTISLEEFKDKTWGVTKQYLEVMEILYNDGLPVIARVEKEDERFAVYFSVKNEKFYYTHYFRIDSEVVLDGIDITPACAIYLRVYSDELSVNEMLDQTTLIPFRTYHKGDLKGNKKNPNAVNKRSSFQYQADKNDAGDFEKKLFFLLDRLESHNEELDKLREKGCELYITAFWEAYIGNTMLGGFYLNKNIIERLNRLGLEVDFDIYASGIPLR